MSNTLIPINSPDDLLFFLESNNAPTDFILSGALQDLRITITGERYQASIPSELARGLAEYQDAIYRAIAVVLYGTEDLRKLTAQQRQAFELNFTVQQGSSELIASLSELFQNLGKEAIGKMSTSDIKCIMIVAITCLTLGYSFDSYLNYRNQQTEHSLAIQQQEQQHALALKQHEQQQASQATYERVIALLAQKEQPTTARTKESIQAFTQAAQDGSTAIVRAASDAETIRIAQRTWDRQAIVDANRRSRKTSEATAHVSTALYRIYSINTESPDIIRLGLIEEETGQKFSAHWIRENISTEDMNDIWNASRDNLPIMLEVNRQLRGDTLERATITMVRRDLEQHHDPMGKTHLAKK